MLSGIDPGLTTFIDPGLTWTTMKKGFRTSSRRSRKPARTLPGGVQQQDDKSSKKGDVSVSEAEKLGASVLGRRFVEKIKHVPFKKRSPLRHSPSTPPQTPSPHCEESQPWTSFPQPEGIDQTTENKHVSGQMWHSKAVFIQDNAENAFLNGKFSELLYGKVGHGEDFSGIALLAAAACNNTISDDTCNVKEGPIVDNFSITEGTDSAISATHLENTTASLGSGNLSLKVSTDEDVSVIHDKSVAGPPIFHYKGESEAERRLSSRKVVRLHWDLNTVMEAWEIPCDDLNVGSEAIPNDGVCTEKPEKLGDFVGYRGLDLALEPFPMPEPISSRHLSEEKFSTLKKVHLEKHEISTLDPSVSDKVVSNSDSLQSQEVSRKTFHLPDNTTSPTELVSSVTCQMSNVEYSASKSGKSGSSNYSPEDENSSVLGTTFVEGQAVVDVDVKRKHVQETPTADAILLDSLRHIGLKKYMPKSYGCFEKFDIEDGCGSMVSHGCHDHVVRDEEITKIQQGYNSPFEDGELRESDVYPCAESDVEADTECVDYDYSDYREGDEFTANQCLSEGCSDSCLNDKSGSLQGRDLQCGRSNSLKDSTSLNNFIGQTQVPEGCEFSTERTSEANGTGTQNILASEFMHGHEVEGSSAGEFGPWETNEKGLPHTEEQSCSDALQRKGDSYMQRGSYDSRFQDGSMFGSERYFERNRPSLPMRGRSQRDGHTIDSLEGTWNSRNNYQTGYPSPRNGSRNLAGAKTNGLNYRDQSRYTNYSSKSEYRPLTRWRSPSGSDDGYRTPRRMVAAREDINHIRSRGRGRTYKQGFSGVCREEYDGPMDSNNATSSSVRLPHYLSRREHNFSPVLNRGTSFSGPHRNPRSRSRSRSPLTFRRQQRNMGMRRCSRSPDFRSETRMGRVRMPFQKSNYAADNENGFISPPRTGFSPQRHLKWSDENCGSDDLVERNPHGRLYGESRKFDSGGSRGRIKRGDYFRPMIRPGRFTEHSDGDVRGQKYGGNSERTNYRDICENTEKNPGLRRCTTSGPIRRFRINERDCFELRNSRSRDSLISGADKRDTPTEDPLRYSVKSMYASGPKLTRIGDYEEHASPSRG